MPRESAEIEALKIPLNAERFFRDFALNLAETLEEVIGAEEAAGLLNIVGQRVGDAILSQYREGLQEDVTPDQVPEVLVDLKRRIQGDFYVIEANEDEILLGNRRCPFGKAVVGRESLCMMTSNVFGAITAQTHGYAKVELEETIAAGASGCRVRVSLRAQKGAESDGLRCREYFRV